MTVSRVLKAIYRSLVAAGSMYVWIPRDDAEPTLVTIPPWHPERLCPDIPLTESEQALDRQLAAKD
ncbi:DUF6059 family protein [Streptomyces sp. NPDC058274]|jgi:hypothetical protein|uniref:DUF6059 family protein n=1 Tax=Streptomyces sp. NPDC058274 TaxID=3346416 RepID=UPI0036E037D5